MQITCLPAFWSSKENKVDLGRFLRVPSPIHWNDLTYLHVFIVSFHLQHIVAVRQSEDRTSQACTGVRRNAWAGVLPMCQACAQVCDGMCLPCARRGRVCISKAHVLWAGNKFASKTTRMLSTTASGLARHIAA